jgi:hypothetical protein
MEAPSAHAKRSGAAVLHLPFIQNRERGTPVVRIVVKVAWQTFRFQSSPPAELLVRIIVILGNSHSKQSRFEVEASNSLLVGDDRRHSANSS